MLSLVQENIVIIRYPSSCLLVQMIGFVLAISSVIISRAVRISNCRRFMSRDFSASFRVVDSNKSVRCSQRFCKLVFKDCRVSRISLTNLRFWQIFFPKPSIGLAYLMLFCLSSAFYKSTVLVLNIVTIMFSIWPSTVSTSVQNSDKLPRRI